MGSTIHLFALHSSARHLALLNRFTAPHLYSPIKRYGKASNKEGDGGDNAREDFLHLARKRENMVKAPSTADEFERVAEEKAKAEEDARSADQGVASQTFEKTYDGTGKAIIGDSEVESVKNRYKQDEEAADYHHKRGDDD